MNLFDRLFPKYAQKKVEKALKIKRENEINNLQSEIENFDISENLPDLDFQRANILYNKAKQLDNPILVSKALKNIQNITAKTDLTLQKGQLQSPLLMTTDVFGYKLKDGAVNWKTLAAMGNFHVVRTIHKKIIDTVALQAKPCASQFDVGFSFVKNDGTAISEKEQNIEIPYLTNFILNCGHTRSEIRGNFEEFLRRLTKDSLVYDWCPYEIVWNKKGEIHSFMNLDATTIKVADTYFGDENTNNRNEIDGHLPSYLQVFDEEGDSEQTEFFEWELAAPKRNPSSSVYQNGYGRSELEDLVMVITAVANSIKYNANQFIDGIPANQLLFLKDANRSAIEQFQNQLRGFRENLNAGSILAINGTEKPEMIDIRKSNKDMEFSEFLAFLISCLCSAYNLVPEIVGLKGLTNNSISYEGNVSEKMKNAMALACNPVLTMISASLNHKVLPYLLNGKYSIKFADLASETKAEKIDNIVKMSSVFTLEEIYKEYGIAKPKEIDGSIIFNPYYVTLKQMELQSNNSESQEENMFGLQKSLFSEDEFENYYTKSILNNLNKNGKSTNRKNK